jgi:hypothetical protein
MYWTADFSPLEIKGLGDWKREGLERTEVRDPAHEPNRHPYFRSPFGPAGAGLLNWRFVIDVTRSFSFSVLICIRSIV